MRISSPAIEARKSFKPILACKESVAPEKAELSSVKIMLCQSQDPDWEGVELLAMGWGILSNSNNSQSLSFLFLKGN